MKNIQGLILEYLEQKENEQKNFENIVSYIQEQKIFEDKQKLKTIPYLIAKISNHHHHSNNFFDKIEKIIIFIQPSIKQSFSNNELFHIFKGNKRILLSFIELEIIVFDSSLANLLSHGKYEKRKYHEYFYPELKNFLNIRVELFDSNPEEFKRLRREGENENQICQIIRKDSFDEFVSYIEKNHISLTTHIKHSIFETNCFLLKREPSLIQYSAFFGSFRIFKYLLQRIDNELIEDKFDIVYCYDDSYKEYRQNLLWLYSIHGCNLMIMQKLKKNEYKPNNYSFLDCLIESIKCHHNEISKSLRKSIDNDVTSYNLKYYNFNFFPDDFSDIIDSYFFDFCKYDYYSIVDCILKRKTISINLQTILNIIFY